MPYQPVANRYQAMVYRRCGRSGLQLPAVSLGLWHSFGEGASLESMRGLLFRAFDLGINFFDTAPSYMGGRNEEMVGKALKGKRDKIFIQTKLGTRDEKRMRDSVEKSLRRLQTDYVDVLLWHGLHSVDEVLDTKLFDI